MLLSIAVCDSEVQTYRVTLRVAVFSKVGPCFVNIRVLGHLESSLVTVCLLVGRPFVRSGSSLRRIKLLAPSTRQVFAIHRIGDTAR